MDLKDLDPAKLSESLHLAPKILKEVLENKNGKINMAKLQETGQRLLMDKANAKKIKKLVVSLGGKGMKKKLKQLNKQGKQDIPIFKNEEEKIKFEKLHEAMFGDATQSESNMQGMVNEMAGNVGKLDKKSLKTFVELGNQGIKDNPELLEAVTEIAANNGLIKKKKKKNKKKSSNVEESKTNAISNHIPKEEETSQPINEQ